MLDTTVTIAIVDDHPVVRDGLRRILETEETFRVVGEAGDGTEAIRLVRQLQPKVALLDLFMPKASGFDVLKELQGSETRFLILTAGNKRADLLEAVRCHAHGILTKDAPVESLLKAIRCVAVGEYWIEPDLLAHGLEGPSASVERFGLSERERQVIAEISAGANNKTIASNLDISELTVKRHLTNVFHKLGVSSRLELAMFAVSHGLQRQRSDDDTKR